MNTAHAATEQPSCVLICGNTKLLDLTALRIACGCYKVVICGELSFQSGSRRMLPRNAHLYPTAPTAEDFPLIMNSYAPDVV